MAIFTKKFIRCDACETEHELPSSNGETWYRLRTQLRRLEEAGEADQPLVDREVDLCPSCHSALQDSEFSSLFEPDSAEATGDKQVVSLPQTGD